VRRRSFPQQFSSPLKIQKTPKFSAKVFRSAKIFSLARLIFQKKDVQKSKQCPCKRTGAKKQKVAKHGVGMTMHGKGKKKLQLICEAVAIQRGECRDLSGNFFFRITTTSNKFES
jgi:hypothetical protein